LKRAEILPDTLQELHKNRYGQIFKIQRYAIHDGPGIRTIVFFQGCPLSCWWCHNPESQYSVFNSKKIDLTNPDTKFSPAGAAGKQQDKISDIRKISLDALMKEIEKDYIFFDQSQGGVTFSGGEPLAQPGFLLNLLHESRKREIHTAVDTSGFAPSHVMSDTADIADLILFDLKLINDDDHIRYTGVSVKPVHDNLKLLHGKNTKVWLRFPLIPGINDNDENIDKIIHFLLFFKKFKHINILPFHKTGEGKYLKLGIKNPMKDTEPPCLEKIESVKKKFEQNGFSAIIGG